MSYLHPPASGANFRLSFSSRGGCFRIHIRNLQLLPGIGRQALHGFASAATSLARGLEPVRSHAFKAAIAPADT